MTNFPPDLSLLRLEAYILIKWANKPMTLLLLQLVTYILIKCTNKPMPLLLLQLAAYILIKCTNKAIPLLLLRLKFCHPTSLVFSWLKRYIKQTDKQKFIFKYKIHILKLNNKISHEMICTVSLRFSNLRIAMYSTSCDQYHQRTICVHQLEYRHACIVPSTRVWSVSSAYNVCVPEYRHV